MKKYYEWTSNERYRSFDIISQEILSIINPFISYSKPISTLWQPFPFRFEENKKKMSNFPYLYPVLQAISEKALNYLRKLIEPHAEILPLHIENCDMKFYALNILTVYDLDLPRCDYWETPTHISDIDVHAFKDNILPESPIFRIKQTQHFRVYISDNFREVVEKNKLTGLLFDDEMKYRVGSKLGKRY